ncbi:hypothetical protein, partial [Mycobacterium sp.]|uniref:hypothetical protein n=1 Tax=Mycobacterium sp. TaxID=1785 RepID=UPI002BF42A30
TASDGFKEFARSSGRRRAAAVACQRSFVSRFADRSDDRKWPSLTAEGVTTNGGHAIHSGRCWLERPLYDAPLPLVGNNWPALDDPKATAGHTRSGRSRGELSGDVNLDGSRVATLGGY